MTNDRMTTTSDSQAEDVPPADESAPITNGSQPSLARKIARRTTDLIAIALILIGALTVARRIGIWWNTDPEDVAPGVQAPFAADSLAPWSGNEAGALLDFGDMPLSLRRRQMAGDEQSALAAVRAQVHEAILHVNSAKDLPEETDRESKLLVQLLSIDPVTQSDDQDWWIYQLQGPLQMVLGVKVLDNQRRIISWGLALPVDEEAWTLITIEPRATTEIQIDSVPMIPLPPDTERTLSVRDPLAGGIVSFRGTGPSLVWQKHFQSVAEQTGWTTAPASDISSGSASLAFVREVDSRRYRADIQMAQSSDGWTGVIQVTRLNAAQD